MSFAPIAIVGRGCVLPGALTPESLWDAIASGRDLTGTAPEDRWGVSKHTILSSGDDGDGARNDRGGYVDGFQKVFQPESYALETNRILGLDPLFQWTLHASSAALSMVNIYNPAKTGVVIGNLSFPSSSMSRFCESQWLSELAMSKHLPENRFMSGMPALLTSKALGLSGPSHALDAACASALIAIRQACDLLNDGRADLMLAGAVNRADDLFIHVGFSALQALSPTGQTRPFHKDADGLLPAEGAGIIALKRLETAFKDGDRILGVIRGAGWSNDGRGRGFLAPASSGQVAAMAQAYRQSGLDPNSIGLIECHATGTKVGDATELNSMSQVFSAPIPIGSLKSNMGHLITAAGVAGVMKVLGAFEARMRPPTLHVDELNPVLSQGSFQVLRESRSWEGPMRAAVSAFGFGGNNAHIIIDSEPPSSGLKPIPALPTPKIALVGFDVAAGQATNRVAFSKTLASGGVPSGSIDEFAVDIDGLRFPPKAVSDALPQQSILLSLANSALERVDCSEQTGVWIGMGTDCNVARYGARWRIETHAKANGVDMKWAESAKSAIIDVLGSEGVLGTMPNIVANRLNSQFDFQGPSGTISAEQGSGVAALEIACRALSIGEIDAAVVGAVDFATDPVHCAAAKATEGAEYGTDGATIWILKRLDDAIAAGDSVYALVSSNSDASIDFQPKINGAHAATGLLQLTEAVVQLHSDSGPSAATVETIGMADSRWKTRLSRHGNPLSFAPPPSLRFPLTLVGHRPQPVLPVRRLQEAPSLPPMGDWAKLAKAPVPSVDSLTVGITSPASKETPPTPLPKMPQPAISQPTIPISGPLATLWQQQMADLQAQHQRHIQAQSVAHTHFLAQRQALNAALVQAVGGGVSSVQMPTMPPLPSPAVTQQPPLPVTSKSAPNVVAPAKPERVPSTPAGPVTDSGLASHHMAASARSPIGLSLSREQLKVHATGNISEIYGPQFKPQDSRDIQTRMPEPPLLLADRVTGMDAEPGSMKKGTIWTETDVSAAAFYLHCGRMPAGILIESGQADLMLISYLGIDLVTSADRAYRLLGCELVYHDHLPAVGDTLCYDIHVDGHARQGDIRLFFFHYDCRIAGRPMLSVREGQAGFFTKDELLDSAGVIWDPAEQDIDPTLPMDPPTTPLTPTTFGRSQVVAFSEGRPWECFGRSHMRTQTHTRTPRIADGKMLFLQSDVFIDPNGGPWGRGYLKTTVDISPDDWFFEGHFKNDPCMPGTLMFEGCLQAMAFYMAALGQTVHRDGWRFQPVRNKPYPLQCRGQVTPTSKKLVYEIFVESVKSGPEPQLIADLLCTIDGLKAFHARGMGLELVPGYPLTTMPNLIDERIVPGPTAVDQNNFAFDYPAMMASALGQPSKAFGDLYKPFDGPRRCARLPGPPYHFMTRVTDYKGEVGDFRSDVGIEMIYEIPTDAWYFEKNGHPVMPFAVFLEAALQPCGWLASASGSALSVDKELFFRNLDGRGILKAELSPDAGVLETHVTMTQVSKSAGMIIESFSVHCYCKGVEVYELETVFGFFPKEALENQVGLTTSPEEKSKATAVTDYSVDLRERPARYFGGSARLADPMLCMLDRVTAFEPKGGKMGLGWLRGEKDVDPGEWFFKAHFFQDPVQPGSLGIEAMIQLLQFYMLETGLDEGLSFPRFEPLGLNEELVWKYRGQVIPENSRITTTMEIVAIEKAKDAVLARAHASLWVDGRRIYEAENITMRLVSV